MAQFDRQILGKNIKLLREGAGLSQHDFSTLVDISKRSLANIEAGRTSTNLDLLDKILSIFNYEIEEICKKKIEIPIDFRETLIKLHKKNHSLTKLLDQQPNIVYAIKFKLLKSDFVDQPKEISHIKSFFKQFEWSYKGTSISNALKRMPDFIEIRRHETKGNTNVYLRRR